MLSELLDLIVGWSGEKIVFLPLFFLQHFRACFNHVAWACADVIITLWINRDFNLTGFKWSELGMAEQNIIFTRFKQSLPYYITSLLACLDEIYASVFRRMQFFCFKCFSYVPFHIEGWTTIWIQFENLFNMKPLTRFTFWSQILLTWEQPQRDGSDSSNSFGFRQWRVYQTLTCTTNSIQVVTCRVLFQNSDSNAGKNLSSDFRKSLN